jgi:hypothetical protein
VKTWARTRNATWIGACIVVATLAATVACTRARSHFHRPERGYGGQWVPRTTVAPTIATTAPQTTTTTVAPAPSPTPEKTTTPTPTPPALAPAPAAIAVRQVSMEGGAFGEFADTTVVAGSLTVDETRGYAGTRSAHARYTGQGANGYARGEQDIRWGTGQEVWYSGAFFLPVGFTAAQQGQVSLMRWDNWSIDPDSTDQGGLVLHSDGSLVLVRQRLGGTYAEVSDHVAVVEGRWVWLEVHQVLSDHEGSALNELWVDGRPASTSRRANTFGRDATRLRWGIVSIGAGGQTNDLELWFDRATISTGRIGPLG